MKPSPESEQNLERFVSAALRDLPARRAPRSLEQRVLAELARRAALPWWHQSFVHWPIAARAAFVVASAGVVKVVLMAVMWVMTGLDGAKFTESFSTQFTWLRVVANLGNSIADVGATLVRSVPSLWLYGGLAAVAALYFTLFGLGTVAYRTLYTNR
jgi:hypothetical protein